jgi:uncharacterized protein affecting Mg2+/Co2+ transport
VTEEIKGPGVRGAMPVLSPGERFEYKSGTRLGTSTGSMHGWFTFEEVAAGRLFATRVGRLALSTDGGSERVPCAGPAEDRSMLPPTSVQNTERVLVGAVAEVGERDDDLHRFKFNVDLQVNNGRSEPVSIVGVRWRIVDAHGALTEENSALGEPSGTGVVKMASGSALRLKATLPMLSTTSGTLSGVLLARFGEPSEDVGEISSGGGGGDDDGGGRSGGGGDDDDGDDDDDDGQPLREIAIGALGLSVDGSPVPSYQPLGFLEA